MRSSPPRVPSAVGRSSTGPVKPVVTRFRTEVREKGALPPSRSGLRGDRGSPGDRGAAGQGSSRRHEAWGSPIARSPSSLRRPSGWRSPPREMPTPWAIGLFWGAVPPRSTPTRLAGGSGCLRCLPVSTSRTITVYTIDDRRSHEVVVEILGRQFAGVLVSDCFTAYDAEALIVARAEVFRPLFKRAF